MTHRELLDTVLRDIVHESIGIALEGHSELLEKIRAQLGHHLTDADNAALDDYLRSMSRFAHTMEASGL